MGAGILFLMVGLAFLFGAADLDIGTTSNMGEGYFPVLLSLLLISVGLGVLWKVVRGRVSG